MQVFELQLQTEGYFNGYNPNINPSAANVFSTAAFRFGHSLIPKNLNRCNRYHQLLPSRKAPAFETFEMISSTEAHLITCRHAATQRVYGSDCHSQCGRRGPPHFGHVLAAVHASR